MAAKYVRSQTSSRARSAMENVKRAGGHAGIKGNDIYLFSGDGFRCVAISTYGDNVEHIRKLERANYFPGEELSQWTVEGTFATVWDAEAWVTGVAFTLPEPFRLAAIPSESDDDDDDDDDV